MYNGRKGTLYSGLGLALVAVSGNIVFTSLFKNFELLLLRRFLAGLGAGIALPAVPAIISDYFHELHARKMLLSIGGVYSLWPGIVLVICGFLTNRPKSGFCA